MADVKSRWNSGGKVSLHGNNLPRRWACQVWVLVGAVNHRCVTQFAFTELQYPHDPENMYVAHNDRHVDTLIYMSQLDCDTERGS